MVISLKPISIKANEWQPQNRIYYSENVLQEIIANEALTTDPVCIQNVGFDAANQIYTNVVLLCSDYHGEFIYLVKTDQFKHMGITYVWAYVVTQEYNTREKVVLSLKIDLIATFLPWFNQKKFKGQMFAERATNFTRDYNTIHPDTCSSMENKITQVIDSDIPINLNVHTFITMKANDETKEIWFNGEKQDIDGKITKFGSAFYIKDKIDPTQYLIAYNTLFSSYEGQKVVEGRDIESVSDFLKLWFNIDFYATKWDFKTQGNYTLFVNFMTENQSPFYGNLDKIINDENVDKWITVPAFFNGIEEQSNYDFEIPITWIKPYLDMKNHLYLHYKYYLCVGKLFKIALDPLQINDLNEPIIYATRVVGIDNIKFYFYYNASRIGSFYDLSIDISNNVINPEYWEYREKLEASYNSGLKSALLGIGPNILSLVMTTIFGMAFGKKWALYNLIAGGTNLLFGEFANYMNGKYSDQEIKKADKNSDNVLMNEVLDKIMLTNTYESHFGTLDFTSKSVVPWRIKGNYVDYQRQLVHDPNYQYLQLMIEKPVLDDELNIKNDQAEFGNILNLLRNVDNPLAYPTYDNLTQDLITQKVLYFKGKIQPIINPVNSFQLELINQTLAEGIKLYSDEWFSIVNDTIKNQSFSLEPFDPRTASITKLYQDVNGELIRSQLPYNIAQIFDPTLYRTVRIEYLDEPGVEIRVEELQFPNFREWTLIYNYGSFKNQHQNQFHTLSIFVSIPVAEIIAAISATSYYLNELVNPNATSADVETVKNHINPDFIKGGMDPIKYADVIKYFDDSQYYFMGIFLKITPESQWTSLTPTTLKNATTAQMWIRFIYYDGVNNSTYGQFNVSSVITRPMVARAISEATYHLEVWANSTSNDVKAQISPAFIKAQLSAEYQNAFEDNVFSLITIDIMQTPNIPYWKQLTDDDLKIAQGFKMRLTFTYQDPNHPSRNYTYGDLIVKTPISDQEMVNAISNTTYDLTCKVNDVTSQVVNQITWSFIKANLDLNHQASFNRDKFSFTSLAIRSDDADSWKQLTDDDLKVATTYQTQISFNYGSNYLAGITHGTLVINPKKSDEDIVNAIVAATYDLTATTTDTTIIVNDKVSATFIKAQLDPSIQIDFENNKYHFTNLAIRSDDTDSWKQLTDDDLKTATTYQMQINFSYGTNNLAGTTYGTLTITTGISDQDIVNAIKSATYAVDVSVHTAPSDIITYGMRAYTIKSQLAQNYQAVFNDGKYYSYSISVRNSDSDSWRTLDYVDVNVPATYQMRLYFKYNDKTLNPIEGYTYGTLTFIATAPTVQEVIAKIESTYYDNLKLYTLDKVAEIIGDINNNHLHEPLPYPYYQTMYPGDCVITNITISEGEIWRDISADDLQQVGEKFKAKIDFKYLVDEDWVLATTYGDITIAVGVSDMTIVNEIKRATYLLQFDTSVTKLNDVYAMFTKAFITEPLDPKIALYYDDNLWKRGDIWITRSPEHRDILNANDLGKENEWPMSAYGSYHYPNVQPDFNGTLKIVAANEPETNKSEDNKSETNELDDDNS